MQRNLFMKVFVRIALIPILLISALSVINAQEDTDPPLPPVLDLVSVDMLSGNVEISWSPSPSPDVSGYVIYLYRDNEGYELDTIYDPAAGTWIRTGSGSAYYSESFVVSALDTAGNISPLSNMLSTIHSSVEIDTCDRRLDVKWTGYAPAQGAVESYRIFYSVNGGSFDNTLSSAAGTTSIALDDFTVNDRYCFFVRAELTGGLYSESNQSCIITKMQRPPDWINADYATVSPDNGILLSFTPDPLSEIRTYDLERKSWNSSSFERIRGFSGITGTIMYSDKEADVTKVNFWRLKAVNSCNKPITESNITSNIVLSVKSNNEDITLSWNKYSDWNGGVADYRIHAKTGQQFEERYVLSSSDTSLTIPYTSLMNEVSGPEICFLTEAEEASNPYTASGTSRSQIVCIPAIERITIPDLFTPDNNSINDLFRPMLSFTPVSYRLLITDQRRKAVFESTDFSQAWDGTFNGMPQPEGVYLWYITVRSPSGREIRKTGTVTIVHNR
ncbi:MAG: gliding motility-associated C-terminal domain-containing protein [Bacteroidales bacterium]|nr:gliding motility-associated C-terminal domain-containing protein [Bacteroidales bacterium]